VRSLSFYFKTDSQFVRMFRNLCEWRNKISGQLEARRCVIF
jgi:hypothetical protein